MDNTESSAWQEMVDWYIAKTKAHAERNGWDEDDMRRQLDELIEVVGVDGAIRCLKEARHKELFGEVLVRHVESRNAWHEKRRGKKSNG